MLRGLVPVRKNGGWWTHRFLLCSFMGHMFSSGMLELPCILLSLVNEVQMYFICQNHFNFGGILPRPEAVYCKIVLDFLIPLYELFPSISMIGTSIKV